MSHRIRCQHCTGHETIAEVRLCHDDRMRDEADALSIQAAEAAASRYYEMGSAHEQMLYAHEVYLDESNAWNDPIIRSYSD